MLFQVCYTIIREKEDLEMMDDPFLDEGIPKMLPMNSFYQSEIFKGTVKPIDDDRV